MILRYFAFYILHILSLYTKKTHTVPTLTDDATNLWHYKLCNIQLLNQHQMQQMIDIKIPDNIIINIKNHHINIIIHNDIDIINHRNMMIENITIIIPLPQQINRDYQYRPPAQHAVYARNVLYVFIMFIYLLTFINDKL